jgi:glycosyltransferase involved in cell wall biosynthesis
VTRSAGSEGILTAAIDSTHLRQGEGGIARYIRGLLAGFAQRDDVRILPLGGGPREKRGTLRKKLLTAGLDVVWYPWLGRWRASMLGADVFHCPAPRGPLVRAGLPVVMTIHDLVPFILPATMTRWSRIYSRATHRQMLRSADRIICNSADTARDAIQILGVDAGRLRVIPLGIDPHFFEPVSSSDAAEGGEPYILFVGTRELRKNLERLEQAVEQVRLRGYPHQLWLAGDEAWGEVRVGKPFVRKLGRVSDEALKGLYAGAACLAIPSLHEGFGLPALEAMAVGTPVVAARAGALPEVTADEAIMVDPLDTADIARGLVQAIESRTDGRDRRRRHARQFTWERAAAATLAVYRELG